MIWKYKCNRIGCSEAQKALGTMRMSHIILLLHSSNGLRPRKVCSQLVLPCKAASTSPTAPGTTGVRNNPVKKQHEIVAIVMQCSYMNKCFRLTHSVMVFNQTFLLLRRMTGVNPKDGKKNFNLKRGWDIDKIELNKPFFFLGISSY